MKPVLATIALFLAVGQWNSWFDTYLYNGSKTHLTTLQYELMKVLQSTTVRQQLQRADEMSPREHGPRIAGIRQDGDYDLVTVPILVVYPFLQRISSKG